MIENAEKFMFMEIFSSDDSRKYFHQFESL